MTSQSTTAGSLSFDHVLLPDGLAQDRRVSFDGNGRIIRIEKAPPGSRDGALAVPGMPNAHSHAFQRALVGRTERPAGRDSFWTWRETMYSVANRISPDDLHVVARQAYADMLAGGFTSVAEFHYLHHLPDGTPGPEMAQAIIAAARDTGIRLSLLPVLYCQGGFDTPPCYRQRRFVHDSVASFCRLLESLPGDVRGVAPHSLRAVEVGRIRELIEACQGLLPDGFPVHIHIAEQRAEVEECRARYGLTPVAHLLAQVDVDKSFHLVHATHADEHERAAIIACDATVVLCPLTEAYLGDGLFAAASFASAGGRLAVGSDSNTRIDVIEELRLLEYGQRLRDQRRLCMADDGTLAQSLWARAARAGARSVARPVGEIAIGRFCDLVVLDNRRSPLAGVDAPFLLDAWLTAGSGADIQSVYVGGEARVVNGQIESGQGSEFAATMRRLYTG